MSIKQAKKLSFLYTSVAFNTRKRDFNLKIRLKKLSKLHKVLNVSIDKINPQVQRLYCARAFCCESCPFILYYSKNDTLFNVYVKDNKWVDCLNKFHS